MTMALRRAALALRPPARPYSTTPLVCCSSAAGSPARVDTPVTTPGVRRFWPCYTATQSDKPALGCSAARCLRPTTNASLRRRGLMSLHPIDRHPRQSIESCAKALFHRHQQEIYQRTDRMFVGLLGLQWILG